MTIDDIMEDVAKEAAAEQAPKVSQSPRASDLELNRKSKALAASRAEVRAKEAIVQVSELAVVADTKSKLRPTCSKAAHLVPDLNFTSPVTAPAGVAWPEGVSSFRAKGFSDVRALSVDLTPIARNPQFPTPTHEMLITAVVATDIGWKGAEIIKTMARTSALLAKCKIQTRLNIVTAKPWLDLTSIAESNGRSLVAHTPVKTKPILYFVKDTPELVRADGSGHAFALTTGIRNMVNSPKVVGHGTAFFGRDTAVKADGTPYDYQAVEDDTFVIPVIHELGHLLGDRDHTDAG
ncbi:MAG: hypothetical protein EON58_20655, partial [Alphaproteobacteria bacterium]